MMGQYRFITCNKCTIVVWDVGNRGGMHVKGLEVYGKPLYHPLNFDVILKLL